MIDRADLPWKASGRSARQTSGKGVGSLTWTDAGVAFAYTADYLAQPGPTVATTLPLKDVPTLTPAGALPAYFAGLLPAARGSAGLATDYCVCATAIDAVRHSDREVTVLLDLCRGVSEATTLAAITGMLDAGVTIRHARSASRDA